MIMILLLSVPVAAVSSVENEVGIYYAVYNENGEVVEEGIIPPKSEINLNYSWDSDITLGNGWYTAFMLPGPKAFYVTKDTDMEFSYTLDRSAKIKYSFYSDSVPHTIYPTTWKTGTKTRKESHIVVFLHAFILKKNVFK